MIEGARPGKQATLGYRQFSGPVDFVAERDAFMKVAAGELRLNSTTGYGILETLRRIPVYLRNLLEQKKIPNGMKHKVESFTNSFLDQASFAEVGIRYEDLLLKRLFANNRITKEHLENELSELAMFADAKRREAAFCVATWIGILQKIAEPRSRGGGRAARLLPSKEDVQDWAVCAFAAQLTVLARPNAPDDPIDELVRRLPEAISSAMRNGDLSQTINEKTDFDRHHDRIMRKLSGWTKSGD